MGPVVVPQRFHFDHSRGDVIRLRGGCRADAVAATWSRWPLTSIYPGLCHRPGTPARFHRGQFGIAATRSIALFPCWVNRRHHAPDGLACLPGSARWAPYQPASCPVASLRERSPCGEQVPA